MIALLSERRRVEKTAKKFGEDIVRELSEIANRLCEMENGFNLVSDNDLIEAAIYEEMALKSRYAFLLRLAKKHNVSCRFIIPELRKGWSLL